jgi:hypothetical protein
LSLKSELAEQKLDAVELVTVLSTCLLVGVAFWAKAAPASPSNATEAISRCLMVFVLFDRNSSLGDRSGFKSPPDSPSSCRRHGETWS